ncbi:Conserved_hypothetical protein [Hexamita inflata]|uniref:Uncharacterized protein n=1 Tax=Hexamita inflata TaxID=28002 RepID=A0ABP1IK14_9EUKA
MQPATEVQKQPDQVQNNEQAAKEQQDVQEYITVNQQFDKIQPKTALITHLIPQVLEQLVYAWSVISQAFMLVNKLGTDYYFGFIKEFSLTQLIVTHLPIAYGVATSVDYLEEMLKEQSQDNKIIVPFFYQQAILGIIQMIAAAASSQLTTLTKNGFIIKVVFSFLQIATSFGYFLRAQQLKVFSFVRGSMIWLFVYFGIMYAYTFDNMTSTVYEGIVFTIAHLFIVLSMLVSVFKKKFASTALILRFDFKKEDFKPNKEMIKKICITFFTNAQMYLPMASQYVIFIIIVQAAQKQFSTSALKTAAAANLMVFVVYTELIKAAAMAAANAFIATAPGLLQLKKLDQFKTVVLWSIVASIVVPIIPSIVGIITPTSILQILLPTNTLDQTELTKTIKMCGFVGLAHGFQTLPPAIATVLNTQILQPIQGITKIVAGAILLNLQKGEGDQARFQDVMLFAEVAGAGAGVFSLLLIVGKIFIEWRVKGANKKTKKTKLSAEEILGK